MAGHAFGPLSSRRQKAILFWQEGQIQLEDVDGAILSTAPVTQRRHISGGPVLLEFADGWRFEGATSESDFPGVDRGRHLRRAEQLHPRLIILAIAAVCIGFGVWKYGTRMITELALWATPDAMVAVIDRSNMALIDTTLADPSQLPETRQAELQEIFAKVAAQIPKVSWATYHLEFRDIDGMGPNAFALPGGTVVITDEFADLIAQPDIIAGVMGHELAHVTQRHALRQMYQSFSSYMLITAIMGDIGPFLEDLLLEGNALMALSFSRTHEAEADHIGQNSAYAAGYDPTALAEFFTILKQQYPSATPEWLSSHPAHDRRIDSLRDFEPDTP
ncbi:M48 family metallopeptidase [Thioclava sp. SK-1]|uniref:M48 family metallopeptidase n=1 Tax=Thioclava sp. SK-1 TaxID=1889770 RepID=UPI00159EFBB6|nr:M48 family metallopeptidase [Thioclava sp. SK-1]